MYITAVIVKWIHYNHWMLLTPDIYGLMGGPGLAGAMLHCAQKKMGSLCRVWNMYIFRGHSNYKRYNKSSKQITSNSKVKRQK